MFQSPTSYMCELNQLSEQHGKIRGATTNWKSWIKVSGSTRKSYCGYHSFNVRPPSDVSWFRFAPVTIVSYLRTINHSDIGVMWTPTERYRLGGLTFLVFVWTTFECCLYPMDPNTVPKQNFLSRYGWIHREISLHHHFLAIQALYQS